VRRVAVVEEPKLRLIGDFDSMYALAQAAIANSGNLTTLAGNHLTDDLIDYDQVTKDARSGNCSRPSITRRR